jgi:hypothetical protein
MSYLNLAQIAAIVFSAWIQSRDIYISSNIQMRTDQEPGQPDLGDNIGRRRNSICYLWAWD